MWFFCWIVKRRKNQPISIVFFSTLYKEYTGNIQSSEFSRKVDEIAQNLSSGSGSEDLAETYKFEVKNQTVPGQPLMQNSEVYGLKLKNLRIPAQKRK